MDRLIKIRKDKHIIGTISEDLIDCWCLPFTEEIIQHMMERLKITRLESDTIITKLLSFRGHQRYPDEIQI